MKISSVNDSAISFSAATGMPAGRRRLSSLGPSSLLRQRSQKTVQQLRLASSRVANVRALRALAYFGLAILIGGGIFSLLEHGPEEADRANLAVFLRRMRSELSNESFAELRSFLSIDDQMGEQLLTAHLERGGAEPALAAHNWDFTGACFFCFTAATTIGYGNYTPQTDAGKILLVFYAVVAIPLCLNAFAEVSDRGLELLSARARKQHKFEQRIAQAFEGFDADRSGKLERDEVRSAMRCMGYKLDSSSTLRARFEEHYDSTDVNRDGSLDVREFSQFVLQFAPDAAEQLEQALTKGYVVFIAAALLALFIVGSTIIFSAFYSRESWSARSYMHACTHSFRTCARVHTYRRSMPSASRSSRLTQAQAQARTWACPSPDPSPSPSPDPNPNPSPDRKPSPKPHPSPNPSPDRKPSPKPHPSPNPYRSALDAFYFTLLLNPNPNRSALDAFYFTIVSYSTIGFGDFSPDPHPSWFAVIFITATFFGLSLTATVVRAASDPAFDWAFTVRQLSPRTWDRAQECRQACVAFFLSGCGLRTAPMMATHQLHEQPHERSATTDAAGSQLGATTEAVGATGSGMLRGCA